MIENMRQMKETKEQLRGLAVDIVNCHKVDCGNFVYDPLIDDPLVDESDVHECRGLREVSLENWPQPVFVVYETAFQTHDIDVDASTCKQLTRVRQAIKELGLEELAGYEYEDKRNHSYEEVDDDYLSEVRQHKHTSEEVDDDYFYYEWEYKCAVVLQVPLSLDQRERQARHRKVASELAKLVWQEEPALDKEVAKPTPESDEEVNDGYQGTRVIGSSHDDWPDEQEKQAQITENEKSATNVPNCSANDSAHLKLAEAIASLGAAVERLQQALPK
jgi:hypothetical protein